MVPKGKHNWLSQQQTLSKIKADMKKNKIQPEDLSKEEIVMSLESLYSHSVAGSRYFYYQDANGWPIGKVLTTVNGSQIFPTFTDRNVFSAQDWESAPRLQGFTGPVWPPREISHLTGSPRITEHCYYCDDEGAPCANEKHCNMDNYAEITRNSQLARVLLQSTSGKGYGLFAWEDIEKDEGLGQYTGKILPQKTDAPDEDYGISIAIGLDVADETKAYVDSTETGSVSRFLNHSCNPNCELLEGRVGGYARIVTVVTSRDIKAGEELTIDYGGGWFETFKEQCRCGEANCQNPPRAPQRKAGNNGTRDGKGKKHGHEPTKADDIERPQKKRRR